MKFKVYYIYIFFILILVLYVRSNLNFTLGDRTAFLYGSFTQSSGLKNVIANKIFIYAGVFGEILFSLFYYRNVFILTDLIVKITPLKKIVNYKILYYSIFFALFSPITIIFTSFAGKDILAIVLSSIFCIKLLRITKDKGFRNFKANELIFLGSLLFLIFLLREITGVTAVILIFSLLIFYSKIINRKLILIGLFFSYILIYFNFEQIYEVLFRVLKYQSQATITDPTATTFSHINPTFELPIYFENLYQAFTGVNALHFNEAYIKSIAISLNTFLNYFFGVLFSFIYWTKLPKLDIYIIPKVIFLLVYFGLYAFLSQNNPGGAVRYMSSVIPILVTYLFTIIPKRRMS